MMDDIHNWDVKNCFVQDNIILTIKWWIDYVQISENKVDPYNLLATTFRQVQLIAKFQIFMIIELQISFT